MGGTAFTVTLDEASWSAASAAIEKLSRGLQLDLSRFIGEELFSITQGAFDREADPATGTPWPEWSPMYAASDGHGSKKLHRRGDLQRSITYEAMPEMVVIGSNMAYAPTHQFGARKGEFGKTKHGVPIPFGDIPARPFLGVPDDFVDRILSDPAVLELLGMTA